MYQGNSFQGEPIPGWENTRVDDERVVATTISGEPFTYGDTCFMAHLVFKRFGRNYDQATAAWCRMLQNDTSVDVFRKLIADFESINKQAMMDMMSGRGVQ